jgi:hypothetical protein
VKISIERRPAPRAKGADANALARSDVLPLDDNCSSQWRESNPAFVRAERTDHARD